jgi:predicted nucleic acid-binding protein
VIEPQAGPYLFDASAQSYLTTSRAPAESEWLSDYSVILPVHVSAVTVVELMRGYLVAETEAEPERSGIRQQFTEAYTDSLTLTKILPFGLDEALIAAQLMALVPNAPSPAHRPHRLAESRQQRLARWRFDIMIAATALVYNLPLIHNNPQDFEPLRALIERMPERFPGVGPLNLISVKRLAP